MIAFTARFEDSFLTDCDHSHCHRCCDRSRSTQVGDIIVKIDGESVHGKNAHEIIKMVVGPENTCVHITVQSQFGYPHVMTAPFQVRFTHPHTHTHMQARKHTRKHTHTDRGGGQKAITHITMRCCTCGNFGTPRHVSPNMCVCVQGDTQTDDDRRLYVLYVRFSSICDVE